MGTHTLYYFTSPSRFRQMVDDKGRSDGKSAGLRTHRTNQEVSQLGA